MSSLTIVALIEGFAGFRVVAETDTSREAIALSMCHQPDLLLMGGLHPLGDGRETILRIRRGSPLSRVIVLSHNGRPPPLAGGESLSADASPGELERMLQREKRSGSRLRAPAKAAGTLTPRQMEVLKHLSEGGGVKRVSRLLGISIKTVETHRAQLMRRLRIFDLAGLVRYALRKEITRL